MTTEMAVVNGTSKITSMEPTIRPVGSTELTLCKSLASGTGITVVSFLFSKDHPLSTLQTVLSYLQSAHPLLRSRLRYHTATKTYSLVTLPAPFIKLQEIDAKATSTILQTNSPNSPFLQIVEHEMNEDMWPKIQSPTNSDLDVFIARLYHLENGMSLVALQFLTAVLDRSSGFSVLNEFLTRLASQGDHDPDLTPKVNTKVTAPLEDFNPKKMAKGIWSTGRNLLSGAVTTLGLTNLSFKDTKSLPRSSRLIRLELDQLQTQNLLAGCKSRGIKLHGALTAAAMIAAHSSNATRSDVSFGLISIFDCRASLNPPLTTNDIGFYSSGVITSHRVRNNESFWNLAVKIHETFTKAKKTGNYFTDLAIGNYLFCKAIENPGLTPSSAQRTALLSVYEEPAIINKDCWKEKLGVEDFIFCGSAHGAGPSLPIINSIHDGRLECIFSYPSPLHSREQVVGIVDKVKNILVDASSENCCSSN